MEREVGGGIGMGNTCKPMAVSFQCMTKSTTIKKIIKKKNFIFELFISHINSFFLYFYIVSYNLAGFIYQCKYFEVRLVFRFPKGLFLLLCSQPSIAEGNFPSFVPILLSVCLAAQSCPVTL